MNSTLVIVVATLIIGLGGGYFIGNNAVSPTPSHMSSDESTMSDTMAGMTAGLQGKTSDEFDQAFIEGMIVHHEGAVEMAQQALQQAKHSEIKQMARSIIDAQTAEITTMRGWLKSWYGIQR